MTKNMVYKCPSCTGEFSYLHHPNVADDPAPRFCPLCGFDTELDDDMLVQAVTSPAIASGYAKGIDGHHRAMEEGAAYRATVSDDPSLKMTDMKDNLRAGDTAYVPVDNTVSRAMAQQPGAFGFNNQAAMEYSAQAHTGPLPNAGARAMRALKNDHAAAGGVVSDLPALETQSPTYRRRA